MTIAASPIYYYPYTITKPAYSIVPWVLIPILRPRIISLLPSMRQSSAISNQIQFKYCCNPRDSPLHFVFIVIILCPQQCTANHLLMRCSQTVYPPPASVLLPNYRMYCFVASFTADQGPKDKCCVTEGAIQMAILFLLAFILLWCKLLYEAAVSLIKHSRIAGHDEALCHSINNPDPPARLRCQSLIILLYHGALFLLISRYTSRGGRGVPYRRN